MDSLVSIYKKMEDSSGVNIFVSQNKPSPPEKEKNVRAASTQKANDKNCHRFLEGGSIDSKQNPKLPHLNNRTFQTPQWFLLDALCLSLSHLRLQDLRSFSIFLIYFVVQAPEL